jgi:chromosome segregation ATPase
LEAEQARRAASDQAASKAARAESLEAELTAARGELQAAQAAVEQNEQQTQAEHAAECTQYERQLSERAQAVKQLKRDLSATETFAAQLLMELEAKKSAGSPAEQIAELETGSAELASLNAEQAADLVANRWRIAELEQRLRDSKPSQLLEEQLQKARTELQRQLALLAQVRETTH